MISPDTLPSYEQSEKLTSSNFLLVISGPTASGKDTVIRELTLRFPQIKRITPYTTRDKRLQEVEGVEYHFVSEQDWQANNMSFCLCTTRSINGRLVRYGIHREDLLNAITEGGHICHLDLPTVQRLPLEIRQLSMNQSLNYQSCSSRIYTVYLGVSNLHTLRQRFFHRARCDDSAELFVERLKQEYSDWIQYAELIDRTIFSDQGIDEVITDLVLFLNEVGEER